MTPKMKNTTLLREKLRELVELNLEIESIATNEKDPGDPSFDKTCDLLVELIMGGNIALAFNTERNIFLYQKNCYGSK